MIISPAKAAEAARVMGIELEGLTPDALRIRYRNKAKECHPDHHADKAEEWARLSWATHVLSHWVTTRPKPKPELESATCISCNGTGRVPVKHRGFGKVLTMQCDLCNGLGTVIEKETSDGD